MNDELTPRRIVEYLDQYIIGQQDAKKSVAVALRNRWRASKLSPEIAKEVSPKNILLIGPTGVGNRKKDCFPYQCTFCKSGSDKVYGSRLCRKRCRIHGP